MEKLLKKPISPPPFPSPGGGKIDEGGAKKEVEL
jgi:hypothetical protein